MAEPILNSDCIPQETSISTETEEANAQQMCEIDTQYAQFAINVDIIQKNIIKEETSYDKKFRQEMLKSFNKEGELSIQSNIRLDHVTAIREEQDIVFCEFNEKTNQICENLTELRQENREKKRETLFANREELITYIACKLMTIKTSEIIPNEDLRL